MTIPTINIAEKRVGFRKLKLENIVLIGNYRDINIERIKELADSIQKVGQIQPALINKTRRGGKIVYELFAGNRRYYANVLLEKEEMPCIIYENLTSLEMSLMQVGENIKKKIDSAGKKEAITKAIKILSELGQEPGSMSKAAEMLGISESSVMAARNYAGLEPTIREAEKNGTISFSMAIEIGRLDDKNKQLDVFKKLSDPLSKIKNAKGLAAYISKLRKEAEAPETLSLGRQEWTDIETNKSEELDSYFQKITSYIRSISFSLKTNPRLKTTIRNASRGNLKLGKLASETAKYAGSFERIINQYNEEGLEAILNPKKKKSILREIIEKREVMLQKGKKQEKVTDIMQSARYMEVDLDLIDYDPEQPRTTKEIQFRDKKIEQGTLTEDYDRYTWTLEENIGASGGVTSPILLRKEKGRYKVITGESRYWGSLKAKGIRKIPALIVDCIDDETCRLIQIEEDLYEKDSSVERAKALANIKELLPGCTEKEFADFVSPYLGLKAGEINDYMRFLRLEKRIQELFYDGRVGFTGVLELSRADKRQRHYLCDIILADELKTRKIKELVDKAVQAKKLYESAGDNTREFLSECERSSRKIIQSEIVNCAIESIASLQAILKKAPAETGFYQNNKMIKSYVSFKKALQEFNRAIKK